MMTERLSTAISDRYRVERELGQGGMATVYLAEDLRHRRRVAVKVLKPELAAVLGADRFVQEITTTAALQHPHILPLFDSGSADGYLFYVMPFIDGETLRAKLDREHQLGIDESVRLARDVAEALEYAHRHGVIHRDIKPENILIADGRPMVADFGIALAVSAAAGGRMTETGLSLGTPHYMSPEQATAEKDITARSDVYSLGSVLYEMLTGNPPHVAATAQQIIMKIVTEEAAPVTKTRKSVPPNVAAAVAKSLEKLPADRFASAREFSDALASPEFTGLTSPAIAGLKRREAWKGRFIIAAAVAALSLIAAALAWRDRSTGADSRQLQFVLDTPGHLVMVSNESAVGISPDGSRVAYVARNSEANLPDVFVSPPEIFVRRLDSLSPRARRIRGLAPVFSPDGKWLFYLGNGGDGVSGIRRIPVDGGSSELITAIGQAGWQGYGVSPRGEIAVSTEGSLWRIDEKGERIKLLSPDSSRGEASIPDPVFLDDETIAFWLQRSDGAPTNGVGITTVKGGEHQILNIAGNRPFGMLDGHLLIGNEDGQLLAYPLDLRKRQVTGPPVVLLDSAVWIITGGLQISIAREGTLAYLRGRSHQSLAVVDRHGGLVAEAPVEKEFRGAAMSPDEKRVAASVSRITVGGTNVNKSDIWMWDIPGKTLARFIDGGSTPRWTSDGQRIAFLQYTSFWRQRVMWQPADGNGQPEVLAEPAAGQTISDFVFVPGGREILVVIRDSVARGVGDIYAMRIDGADRALRPVVTGKFNEFSPLMSDDGRWLAYGSNESGRSEIYVRSYASPGTRLRITTRGGSFPQWMRGASRLVFTEAGRRMVVGIEQRGGAIVASSVDTLAADGTLQWVDGKASQLLVTRDPPGWRIVIVKNWLAEARRKLSGK